MKKIKLLTIITIFINIVGCATEITPEVTVWEWWGEMQIVDDQYRSTGSSDAVLGSYGRRLDEGLNRYHLDGPLINKFSTRKPRVVILSFDNLSELKELGFKIAEEAELKLIGKIKHKGKYRLVVVKPTDPSLFEKAARSLFASDSFFRGKAKNENFRYIDSVAYIVDYDATESINWSAVGHANIDRIVEGFNLGIKVGQDNTSSVKLPDQQIIAYQFRRLCWDKGQIVDAVTDLIGGDANACGQGYYKYPGKEKG